MLVYEKCECFVMQMYVCVFCASCGSPQCFNLLMLVKNARGNHMEEAYSGAGLIIAL